MTTNVRRPLSALAPPFRPTVQPGAARNTTRRAKPATHAVLNTVELMENVFAFLTPKQLITISRVCKTFNTIVKTSPSVQQALFQRPNPQTKQITWKWEGPRFLAYCEDAKDYIKVNDGKAPRQTGERDIHYINPLLVTLERGYFMSFLDYAEESEETCVARFVLSSRFRLPGPLLVIDRGPDRRRYNSPADRIYAIEGLIVDVADSATCRTMHLADPPVRKVIVEMFSANETARRRFERAIPQSRRFTIERTAGVLFGDVVDLVRAESIPGPRAYGLFTVGDSQFDHIEFPDGFAITLQEKESMQRRVEKEKKIQQFRDEMALIACTRR